MKFINSFFNNIFKSSDSGVLTSRNRKTAYFFLLPNFIGFFVFTLIPIAIAFFLCFVRWDFSNPMRFVGLQNFTYMFTDSTFRIALKNTIFFSLVAVPSTMVISLGLAILLNKIIKGVKFLRTMYFIPYITSMVAVAIVWNMLYSPSMGPINSFLRNVGINNPPGWTASTDWSMIAIIIMSVWKQIGYYMVIYLAGLQGIPSHLYEAATIDGANSWQKFKYITLPMLTPTTFFVSIMLLIGSFKVFTQVMVMTGGGPGRSSNVLVYYIYNQAFVYNRFGYASAIAFVLFFIVLAITIFQFKKEEKWVNYTG
ncbi:carbohydrate ABC transporter membrane protein 1 (CUT1 family) [Halanaerobium saccharolyticum]|uniref:Carbohydrate ABC transporter membrane protein 1 (CUT1 family) n=1 Tax=Halanaerobium saccharolyticum TaxID=43595 RepID=A0A4R7YVH8_9FIRM|nr:sugar ABC transporter permease [Halanaerobium saccharolyticum]RAK05172.1 carbohydrate ABC transporter membrane protein 1 (CUT1 family) [Halanaerobium saccharolyticum]TDV99003.1 carbohydrate ABC transporter membrane protein 1 (CUT1 family) [Halanaerobium saccharolyticum]TDX51694.1 carbohydrate ABC transporter membrane protein 1 (CUT1 family) [Halanaerobium saccharolyticum]